MTDNTGNIEEKVIVKKLKSSFADSVHEVTDFRGDLAVTVDPAKILDICTFLKTDPDLDFKLLLDVCGVDYLHMKTPKRFAVVYHMYSLEKKHRLRLKAYLDNDNPEIDSVYTVWKASYWFEREAFDLYGIQFKNHPNLQRILTHPNFQGHPLRKDYDSEKRHPQFERRN
jgi:NADH-quinone oxidoreductase subunit C